MCKNCNRTCLLPPLTVAAGARLAAVPWWWYLEAPPPVMGLTGAWVGLIGSLKLSNVLVFIQLIHRQTRTKISCIKTQTFPNLRLLTTSGHELRGGPPLLVGVTVGGRESSSRVVGWTHSAAVAVRQATIQSNRRHHSGWLFSGVVRFHSSNFHTRGLSYKMCC